MNKNGVVIDFAAELARRTEGLSGHAWIYCRKYISHGGQQFVSCKQVSSHLQSLFHHADARLQVTHMNENILQEQRVTTENSAGVVHEEQEQLQFVATNSDVSGLYS